MTLRTLLRVAIAISALGFAVGYIHGMTINARDAMLRSAAQ